MTAAVPAQDRTARTGAALPVLAGLVAVALLVGIPVAGTVVLGAAPYEAIARIFPGFPVAVTTALLRATSGAAALVSIGALVHLMFLRQASAAEAFELGDVFELRVLQRASGIWMLSAAGLMLFDPLDTTGVALGNLLMPGVLAYVQTGASSPGALVVAFIGATIVTLGAHFARRWTGLLLPLLAAIWAVLAPIVIGHVLVGPDHDLGNDAAVIQAFASYALLGSLVVLAFRAWTGRSLPVGTVRRVRLIGYVALPVIVVTEAVITWFLLAGTGLLDGLSGWLIVAKWAFLAVVAVAWVVSTSVPGSSVAGHALNQRKGNRADLAPAEVSTSVPGSFLAGHALNQRKGSRAHRVALSFAVVAIGAWLGTGVLASRVPTPQYFVDTTVSQIFMGFDVLAEPTLDVLFTHWRLNLLLTTIAVAAVVAYLIALARLRRRGDKWPAGRTVAWLLGWSVVVFASSSGFGRYSAAHFGVHMIVHMSLNMLAPLLLVLGGFLTLMLRASRADSPQHNMHDWIGWLLDWPVLRALYNPILVFVLFIGSYYGLYLTELFSFMVRYHWAHQLMNLHFLLIGYLYYGLVIGVDRTPRSLPHLGRLGLVMAAMPFHAFFGVIIMGSKTIIAKDFYTYLDLPWMDLVAAQYMGGGVAWAGGEIPALIVVIALGVQWATQDAKEGRRLDRHFDSGRDSEFDDYNEMLRRLGERDAAQARKEPRA